MARAPKLKVFRTAIGFHDAYVAAPSRAAALRAWGATKDLFARGAADEVLDPALAAEPLAAPGTVVKRLRGTAAEQLAALPPDRPKPTRAQIPEPAEREEPRPKRSSSSARKRPAPAPAVPDPAPPPPPAKPKPAPKPAPKPMPSRAALDAAEQALADARDQHRAALQDLRRQEEELARRRRDLAASQAEAEERLTEARDRAERAYRQAIDRWAQGDD